MRPLALLPLLALLACASPPPAPDMGAQGAQGALPPIARFSASMEAHEGLLPLRVDRRQARVYAILPAPGPGGIAAELIYLEGLTTGLGSNPVGLDRGQLGDSRIVQFRRVGARVLVEQPNLAFRALGAPDAERQAVEQSFARSVLWAGPVVAEDPDGRFLVDLTGFIVRDAHDSAARLAASGQGKYRLDAERSTLDPDAVLAFPDNVELEAILTFAGDEPGPLASSVTPTPQAITLVQHHSLVRLPDDGYEPRPFDPRMGMWGVGFADYAAPLDRPLRTMYIGRHRLEKTDPMAASSPVVEPIVYYVDRGAPEPVRGALLDGARWWAAAFEDAGFEDAFRVELLPEGAHPLDVRYNVIQWVHRRTRGWSYGHGVVDPRTGEIIKGHVSLGSLRVRQDRLLFEGLLGTAKTGSGDPDDPLQLALARIRQLSAHEVGHTLGIIHNFAASTYDGRASVMDYPAPLLHPSGNGGIDASEAYGVGVGSWDRHTVRWAYAQFPPRTDEAAALEGIVQEGLREGLLFIADDDARPRGGAHPLAHLWDNGDDPAASLTQAMEVRRRALARFGRDNLADGQPLALLHEVFVPLYLHHRYQAEAAVKLVGGVDYSYAVDGDSQGGAAPVDAAWQRRALDALLATLDPAVLDIDRETQGLLLPRPFGYAENRELFDGSAGPVFDPLGAAAVAIDLPVGLLLEPARLLRLVQQHREDPDQLSLPELLGAMRAKAFAPASGRERALAQLTRRVLADRLVERAADPGCPAVVRGPIEATLQRIARLAASMEDPVDRSLAADITRYLDEREWDGPTGWRPPAAPPGSPIGSGRGCSRG